ncbi:MAG: 50S ribosomal protein L32 [Ardenticatenia bacterium]|nr:50S ribosomal protein L32 [Ardenticatenia bacterium]
MGAVPKKKVSRARRNRRKAMWMRMQKAKLVPCPRCHELTMPYHICHHCGYYRGIQYIEIEEEE